MMVCMYVIVEDGTGLVLTEHDDANVTVLLREEARQHGRLSICNCNQSETSRFVLRRRLIVVTKLDQIAQSQVHPWHFQCCLLHSNLPTQPIPLDTLVFWNGVPCNGWWGCFMAGWRVRWSACSVYWGRPPRGRARRCPPPPPPTQPPAQHQPRLQPKFVPIVNIHGALPDHT